MERRHRGWRRGLRVVKGYLLHSICTEVLGKYDRPRVNID